MTKNEWVSLVVLVLIGIVIGVVGTHVIYYLITTRHVTEPQLTFSWTVTQFFLESIRAFFSYLPYVLSVVLAGGAIIYYFNRSADKTEKIIKDSKAQAAAIVEKATTEAQAILSKADQVLKDANTQRAEMKAEDEDRRRELEAEYQRKNHMKAIEIQALQKQIERLQKNQYDPRKRKKLPPQPDPAGGGENEEGSKVSAS